MKYDELIAGLRKSGAKLQVFGKVKELGRFFNLYKIFLDNKSKKTFLITSGFHGEEFNGPVSLLKNIKKIISYAKKRNINIIIYPCINPSGFELKQRYNASSEKQNNDFLRYQVKNGKWVGTIKSKNAFINFKLIYSPAKEVRALQEDLHKSGLLKNLPVAVLDLHQDDELAGGEFYAYIFGKRKIYEKIMKRIDKIGDRCRDIPALNFDDFGNKVSESIDRDGFLTVFDGTLTDMFGRLGVSYFITAETNTSVTSGKVTEINWIWIENMIDLAVSSA